MKEPCKHCYYKDVCCTDFFLKVVSAILLFYSSVFIFTLKYIVKRQLHQEDVM